MPRIQAHPVRSTSSSRAAAPPPSPLEGKLLALRSHDDRTLATDAAVVLAALGHPEGLRPLADVVRSGARPEAERALRALAESRRPAALQHIVGGFESKHFHVRVETFYALAKLGTPAALDAMVAARDAKVLRVPDRSDPTLHRFVSALAGWSGPPARIEALVEPYTRRGPADQRHLAKTVLRYAATRPRSDAVLLQQTGRTDAAVESLIRKGHSTLAASAARAVAHVGLRRFAPAIEEALREGSCGALERKALLAALKSLGSEGLPELARQILRHDQSEHVREVARTIRR